MTQREHQCRLDARRELETALEEGVRINRAAIEQLERRTDVLLERMRTTDRAIEAILGKLPRNK